MRQKNRYLITFLLMFPFTVNAQETHDYQYYDSLTYKYYLEGDWRQTLRTWAELL